MNMTQQGRKKMVNARIWNFVVWLCLSWFLSLNVEARLVKRSNHAPQITCPGDIVVIQERGYKSARVTWKRPVGLDVEDGQINVHLATTDNPPGSRFFVGITPIVYKVQDSDGLHGMCSFTVEVKAVKCTRPWDPAISTQCHNVVYRGEACSFTCKKGYWLKGASRATCSEWGTFSPSLPTCQAGSCGKPELPQGGWNYTCSKEYEVDSICSVLCKPGHKLNHPNVAPWDQGTTTCLTTGRWSAPPLCDDTHGPRFTSCPLTQLVYTDRRSNTTTAIWAKPTAVDNSGIPPIVTHLEGPSPGDSVGAGSHLVKYEAVDETNKKDFCKFFINVQDRKCTAPKDYHKLMTRDCDMDFKFGSVCHLACKPGTELHGSRQISCELKDNQTVWREPDGKPTCLAKPEEGSLRLVGGQKPSEGRVEIFHAGHWGTICDDGMNNIDAAVICRQLSYSGQSFALKNAAFGEGGGVIWLDNVRCTGKESRLVDCFHRHWMDVACRDSEVISVVCNSTNVLEGSVRLVDGLVDSEGRVEIFHSGIWGTVCGDDFTETVAKIVCQQLGYSGLSLAFGNALFGEGGGVIWMHGIRCSGTESNITSCLRRPWGTSQCKHKQDASVVCHASKGVDGSVRLVGGKRRSEGRVEVFYAGNWGTVCVDKHNMGAATVICRQLGYYRESILLTKSVFKPGKDRIWLDGVGCSGLESNITDCRHRSWGDSRCDHSDDSAVMCDVLPVSRDSKVRRRIAYIDFYTDPRYTQETSEPFQLGSRVYVQVVARMREDVKLLVNNCTMSSDRAGNNDVIPLVRNRYAASNSVHMIGSSDRFTRFYVDVQQNNAYINCEVSFCNSFDFSPPCQNGCHRQCP